MSWDNDMSDFLNIEEGAKEAIRAFLAEQKRFNAFILDIAKQMETGEVEMFEGVALSLEREADLKEIHSKSLKLFRLWVAYDPGAADAFLKEVMPEMYKEMRGDNQQ
jgi:hypothetical protein